MTKRCRMQKEQGPSQTPAKPSKKEREEHEETHAQYQSWCIACVRGRGIAMKHLRSTGAWSDEGKLHTFVMDYCFPSQGKQQGNTVLVVKEIKTKAISTIMVPNNGANEYLVKAAVEFMSGYGCGRAILKSDGEPAIVALQEVKNARQGDTILENSPKRDTQPYGAADNASEGSRRNDTHVEGVCREKLKAVIDNKHVLLPWLVMHAGVTVTRYKTVHGGKTYKRPSNKMPPFGENVVWMMPKDNHGRNKLVRCIFSPQAL